MTDMSIARSAFRTTPQGEFKARDELSSQGVTAEVPFETRWSKRHHRQKQAKSQDRPLMTGYVIVKAKRDERLADAVRRTKHVKRYVGSIRDGEMAPLHAISGRKVNEPRLQFPTFRIGETVSIPKGRWTGIKATVSKVIAQSVYVEFEMLGGKRMAIVSAYDLVRPPG